jgi:hypothetical protein
MFVLFVCLFTRGRVKRVCVCVCVCVCIDGCCIRGGCGICRLWPLLAGLSSVRKKDYFFGVAKQSALLHCQGRLLYSAVYRTDSLSWHHRARHHSYGGLITNGNKYVTAKTISGTAGPGSFLDWQPSCPRGSCLHAREVIADHAV